MLDETILKAMDAEFKTIKPLSEDQKKPKVPLEGEAATESRLSIKKEPSNKQDGKSRDLSV
jgi:hypothetical protein